MPAREVFDTAQRVFEVRAPALSTKERCATHDLIASSARADPWLVEPGIAAHVRCSDRFFRLVSSRP
jgi:hypothetical protein